MKPTDFAQHLTYYLSSYLPGQRGVSSNTIKSYRDTFCLLLEYCRDYLCLKIEKLQLKQLDNVLIEGFLLWLENERGNSVSTRNQRLAAIHAFYRYLQTETPEHILLCQRNLAIPFKKHQRPHINYISAEEVSKIFSKPDCSKTTGRRDLLIMSMLYDTGARVSELINLKVRDVRLDEFPVVTLTGKGNKVRHVPLMTKTAVLLRGYIAEHKLNVPNKLDDPLFSNRQDQKLTRAGVTYILQKYTENTKITPHVLRHTKAMHLLQAGVNILYIKDLLGHVDIATTEIYARADTEMKRSALEKVYQDLTPKDMPSWNDNSGLMDWLHSLG